MASLACRTSPSLSLGPTRSVRGAAEKPVCRWSPPQKTSLASSENQSLDLLKIGSPNPRLGVAQRRVAPGVARAASNISSGSGDENILLEVKGLKAIIAETGKEILNGVDLVIREGEIHAIMGKNGSGKSTLTKVLVGHPDYEVTEGTAIYKGENLFDLEPEERSHAGLFLSFQSPVEVPGVNNVDFLRLACNSRRAALGMPELDPLEFYGFLSPKLDKLKMDPVYLQRNVNEGFSGGEKKRNEILQLAVLEADLAILDEIDSGLDIDALRDVSNAVNGLKTPRNAILMITHYQRLLDYISPQFVHIMEKGKIVMTGDIALAKELEAGGYAAVRG